MKQKSSILALLSLVMLICFSSLGHAWTPVTTGLPSNAGYLNIHYLNGAAYVSVAGQGVYKSIDGGNSWAAVNSGLPNPYHTNRAMTVLNGTLYVGLDNLEGVYKSTNGGATWTLSGLSGVGVGVLYATNNIIYAGSPNHLYKSTDFGANWTEIGGTFFNSKGIILGLNSLNGVLYAGTYDGLFKSTDGGDNWTALTNGIPSSALQALSICVVDNIMYVTTGTHGVYKSTDEGASWTSINNGLSDVSKLNIDTIYKWNGNLYLPTSGNQQGVYKSTDGGANWQPMNTGLSGSSLEITAVYPINGTLFASTGYGLFKDDTVYCYTWTPVTTGLPSNAGYLNIHYLNGAAYVSVAGQGVYKSIDGGNSWAAVNSGLPNPYHNNRAMTALNGALYVGLDNLEGVYKSTNGGSTWVLRGLSGTGVGVLYTTNNVIYAGSPNHLYKSTDFGANWTEIGNTIFNSKGIILGLNSLKGALYAGTYGGIFKSYDGGDNWYALVNGIPSTGLNVLSIHVADNTIYVTTRTHGVYKSTDEGASWTSINNGLPDVSKLNIDTIYKWNGNLYLSTSGNKQGVYKSTDDGANWQPMNTGLPGTSLEITAVYPINGVFFASTGYGLFKYVLTDCPDPSSSSSSSTGAASSSSTGIQPSYCYEWNPVTNGLPSSAFFLGLYTFADGATYASTANQGIYKSTDGGNSWTAVNSGLPNLYTRTMCELINGAIDVGLDASGGVYKTTNGGTNWTATGLAGKSISGLYATNNELYAGGYGFLRKSTDFGVSWTELAPSTFVDKSVIRGINSLNGSIYVGTYSGGLLKSSNGGATWTTLSNGIPTADLGINSIYVADNTIYVTTAGNGVYKSTNEGASWTSINNGLSDVSVLAIDTIRKVDGVLYLSTSGNLQGVYKSTDDGANWQQMNTGLSGSSLQVHSVNPIDGTLFAGTGDGLFKYVLRYCPGSSSSSTGEFASSSSSSTGSTGINEGYHTKAGVISGGLAALLGLIL